MPTPRARGTIRTLLLGLLLLMTATGCAAMIVSGTGTRAREFAIPSTRAEVHRRFGVPQTTAVGPAGVPVETYRLRKVLEGPKPPRWAKGVLHGLHGQIFLLLGVTWLAVNIVTYGGPEVALAGVTYFYSAQNAHELVYVYDGADRVLVHYPVSTQPATRLAVTERELTRRLLAKLEANEAPLTAAVETYTDTVRSWASYLAVPLPSETVATWEQARVLATETDAGHRSRTETVATLATWLIGNAFTTPPGPPEEPTGDFAPPAVQPL